MTRRGPGRPRGGFVVGLLVFSALTMVTLGVYSFLGMAGTSVRQEKLSLNRGGAHSLALSGIKYATHVLRQGRPYGGGNPAMTLDAFRAAGLHLGASTLGAGDLDLVDGEQIHVVYESTGGQTLPREDGGFWIPLHHVDVFARGTSQGRSVVVYGAFLMLPEPNLMGTSTDGWVEAADGDEDGTSTPAPRTTKRMVRLTSFRDGDLQDIDSDAVRDAIRGRVAAGSAEFLDNYARVRWDHVAAGDLAADSDEAAATTFMAQFRVGSPPDGEAVFMRDRVNQLIFEGTDPADRPHRAWSLEAGVEPCSAEVNIFLALHQIKTGGPPAPAFDDLVFACEDPGRWDYPAPDPGSGDPPALDAIQDDRDIEDPPAAGYRGQVENTQPLTRDFSYSATVHTSLPSHWVPTAYCSGPGDWDDGAGGTGTCSLSAYVPTGWVTVPGVTGYVDVATVEVEIGAPAGVFPYTLNDGASGVRSPVSEVFDFLGKYYGLDGGRPLDDPFQGSSSQLSPGPPPPPPGGGGGGGGGGGSSTLSGGGAG